MEKFIYRRRTAGVSHPEMLIEDFLRVNREIVLRGVVDSALLLGGKGAVKIFELEIGDSVLAASPQGTPTSSEVIFMHDHKETSATVQIFVADDMMELTPAHMVAVHTETCGLRYCSDAQLVPAKQIRAGDKIYVSDSITTAVQVCGRVDQTVFRTLFHFFGTG